MSFFIHYFFYSTDQHGYTPAAKLFYSVSKSENYSVGKLLVKHKLYNPTFYDIQMLYLSPQKIDFNYLAWIMEEKNMRIPYVMISKNPLNTKTEDIDWFLNKGIDINNYYFIYPRYSHSLNSFSAELITPLSLAYHIGRYDLVMYLLEKGANPNMSDLHIKNMQDCFGKRYCELISSDKYITEYPADNTLRNWLEEHPYDEYGATKKDELIKTLKEYEEKYNKEHPNWKDEWVFDW